VKGSSTPLSKHDREALVELLTEHAKEISRNEPERLVKLHRDIELVSLDRLIERFDDMLSRPTNELDWQKLLKLNPFILTMLFGYPIVLVPAQGHVGGTDLEGRGDKIADFVTKNTRTNNVALVEIKKPGTPLILDQVYRDGVHKIASEFTSAIVQVLDQRQLLMTNIATIGRASRGIKIESHSVPCIVIAGRMPNNIDQQKALELYRGALKDVAVLTFDELRDRLSNLRDYLSGGSERPPIRQDDLANHSRPTHRPAMGGAGRRDDLDSEIPF
jgi:hypothetical protein